jgi:16S rRNA (adenine1518-N6/adenine1519-N6)-dimethyltransferase
VTARLRGAREGGVVPKKALGQHFLADPNILRVIGRLAELDDADVVLEVGPGLGVLTRYLADRVAHVHAVELDRSLEPHLHQELASAPNVGLIFGDALDVDPSVLDPVPRKLVSNLPYSIATPVVVETLLGAPALELWCVMVQREVAERFFAAPGSKAYGAVSVLVQLTSSRTGFHPVSRTVFRPRPNVDSALVAFRRIPPPADFAGVRRVVDAAFGHRRKTLANALALGSVASRGRAVDALAVIGARSDARAESLEPAAFVALADALREPRSS